MELGRSNRISSGYALMLGSGFGETRRPILRKKKSGDPLLDEVDAALAFGRYVKGHLILHFGNCMMI
jgi:hypothetical protein